jgi:hypothetical protein
MVRFLLGQLAAHVLRKDAKLRAWYRQIKRRRGSKIARVAVMRRLTVIMWRMLAKHEAYHYEGVTEPRRPGVSSPHEACQMPDRETILAAYPSLAAAAARSAGSTGSKEVGSLSPKQT